MIGAFVGAEVGVFVGAGVGAFVGAGVGAGLEGAMGEMVTGYGVGTTIGGRRVGLKVGTEGRFDGVNVGPLVFGTHPGTPVLMIVHSDPKGRPS